jgi:hypothetical protein
MDTDEHGFIQHKDAKAQNFDANYTNYRQFKCADLSLLGFESFAKYRKGFGLNAEAEL